MAKKRPMWALSFRTSLLVLLPLFTAVTGVVLNVRSYVGARETVNRLAGDLFREVSNQTAAATRAHLNQARPTAALQAVMMRQGGLPTDDSVAMATQMLAMLDANPAFSWVSYGGVDGMFAGAQRLPDGTTLTNRSWFREDGRVRLEEHIVGSDGSRRLNRENDDFRYDPRTRPWFVSAREADGPVWQDPYVFYDQGLPGITLTAPARNAAGEFVGAFTVDFDLNVLSEVVRRLSPSEHGEVFITTAEGSLVGHPTVNVVETQGDGDQGRLLTLSDVEDPVTAAFASAVGDRMQCSELGQQRFDFTHDGEDYLGMITCFDIDAREGGNQTVDAQGHRWVAAVVAPESDFLDGVRKDIARGAIVSLVALILSVLLALFLADRIARPLAEVSAEMDGVGRFELSERPMRHSRFSEIQKIGRSLSAMKSGLRSFAAFVPQDVVKMIVQTGEEAELGGELREITLFFSDLAGFTSMSERMAPDELVKRLGVYLDEVTHIITEHGGTVDKFIGDAVMAFWGAPHNNPDHARDAVRCALAVQARLNELSATPEGAWMRATHTRIGLATGEVLVGNVGTPQRMNYTAMGDAVNLAARLEALNKQYGTRIMLSDVTKEAAGDTIISRAVDLVAVKGKQQGVRVYEPIALSAEASEVDRDVARASTAALDAYVNREFADAADEWRHVLKLRPGDAVAMRMLDQTLGFADEPPPMDWSGVHFARTK